MRKCIILALGLLTPSLTFGQDSKGSEIDYSVPESVKKPAYYTAEKEIEVTVTDYETREDIRWCYNRKRRCWYRCRCIVRVPIERSETRTTQQRIAVNPIIERDGVSHKRDTIVIVAPDSAGVIKEQVERRIRQLFKTPRYELVLVEKNDENLLDFRSPRPIENELLQVVIQIDQNNPKRVLLDLYGLNTGNPADSVNVVTKASPIASKAIVE